MSTSQHESMIAHLYAFSSSDAHGLFSGGLFGPISKDYCFFFYIGMVVCFVLATCELLLALGLAVAYVLHSRLTDFARSLGVTCAVNGVSHLLFYVLCRLLYTMCIS